MKEGCGPAQAREDATQLPALAGRRGCRLAHTVCQHTQGDSHHGAVCRGVARGPAFTLGHRMPPLTEGCWVAEGWTLREEP